MVLTSYTRQHGVQNRIPPSLDTGKGRHSSRIGQWRAGGLRFLQWGLVAIGATSALHPASAFELDVGDTKVNLGGFIDVTALYSRFSDAAVPQGTGRDFYIPTQVPISSPESPHSYFDVQAKETRLWLGTVTQVASHDIESYLEMDFASGQINQTINAVSTQGGSPGPVSTNAGNKIAVNAYNPALRRAYLTIDNWLIGQDWSTFRTLENLTEGVDFIGPTESAIFVRQPQVRYTHGGFQVALETPESYVYASSTAALGSKTDDNTLPDLVVRYNFSISGSDFAVAALGRQLRDQGTVSGVNDTALGYGLTTSAIVQLSTNDQIRYMFTGGRGIGRYIGLGTIADAAVDQDRLKATTEYAGFINYHHAWTPQLRSNLTVSDLTGADFERTGLTGGATVRSQSASTNLMYSPVPKMNLGIEWRVARRTQLSEDLSGNLARIQVSARYFF